MSTSHPRFTLRIEGSPETIFDLIADMPNYGRWLPGSEAFGGATPVSPYPVRLRPTHLHPGPSRPRARPPPGDRPPQIITLHHPLLVKQEPPTPQHDVP